MNKKELGEEILANMNVTKEQYIEMCKLCDELELEPGTVESEPEEPSWDDVLGQ